MASFKFEKAIVVGVGPIQEVSQSFKKRELIISIDNDGQYPQKISIEAVQDKCNDQNLNEVRIGDEVTVDINIRGNEWFDQSKNITKYFNQLVYWKMSINRTSAGNNTQQNQQNFQPQGQQGYQQHAYGQPQQQFGNPPAQQQQFGNQPQQQQFQQAPPAQQFGQPNQQFGQPVQGGQPVHFDQQGNFQQGQPQQQAGYTNLPPVDGLPF